MPDVDERLAQVEQRLDSLGERMDERFGQVDQRFEQIDGRLGSLEVEVRKLRLLEEQHSSDIKRIAEVQTHQGDVLGQHGAALQRIEKALEPLTVLPTVIKNVLPDHERRITALEQTRPQRSR